MRHQWSWTPSLPSRGLQCVHAQLGRHQDAPQTLAIAHQEPRPATCRILASGSISNLRRWVSPDTPLVKSNIHIKESAPLHGAQSHTPPRAPCDPASLACRSPHPQTLCTCCALCQACSSSRSGPSWLLHVLHTCPSRCASLRGPFLS